MNGIILHHYGLSPYSEKIRAILGYKKLAWHSVTVPVIMPKPDVVALTGGYRRAPAMQLGRDIYCDTRLIARVLDRLQPEPPLVPAHLRASCQAFAALQRNLFFATIPAAFQPAGLKFLAETLGPDVLQQFGKDRELLFSGGSERRPSAAYSKLNFLPLFNSVDTQLAASPFLLGETPTLADFIVWHCAWFVLSNGGVASQFDPFKNLLAWAQRMRALGHGQMEEMSSAKAIAVARGSSANQPFDGPLLEPEGVKLGQTVQVNATDYGCDPVTGTLVHASVFEVAVKRTDGRAGEVIVHFPREGFRITAAT
ncbi:MAG TPA: glutathione S-transferase family protein [Nevskia sp.]|nr:glutathione S-transferase family protein [Nevskia sp.]